MAGFAISGSCMNPAFSSWFGRNSTRTKCKRLAGDLALHLGQRISGSRDAVRRDYLGPLARHLTQPLVDEGGAGVEATIARLDEYGLSREDLFEALPDLQLGDAKVPGLDKLDTKAKTHFTKTYNAGSHTSQALQPQNLVAKKKRKRTDDDGAKAPGEDDDYVDDDDDDDEEEEDLSKLMKKKKKAPAKRKAPAKKPAAAKKAKAAPKAKSPFG